MLPVSAEWIKAVRNQFRYPAYMQYRVQVVPPGLAEGLGIQSESTEEVSSVVALSRLDTSSVTPYSSLEPNRWVLNGKYRLLRRGGLTDDWWSKPLDSACVVVFQFDQTYNVPGVYFEWDVVNNTYPSSVVLRGFNASGKQTYEYSITSIASSKGFVETPMDNVLKVELEVLAWSREGWRARINDVTFGFIAKYDSINNGKINSATTVDRSTPLAEELPSRSVKVLLRNTDQEFDPTLQSGVSKYLDRKQLVEYRMGFTTYVNPQTGEDTVEWLPWMPSWLETFEVPKDSKDVSITSVSKLEQLTQNFDKDEYTGVNRSLYDIATAILKASGVVGADGSMEPWRLSERLKYIVSAAPVYSDQVNSLLQLIASAGACWLRSDPMTDYIIIDPIETSTSVHMVNTTTELGDPAISVAKQVYIVSVCMYNYSVDKNAVLTELSNGSYKLKGYSKVRVGYNCALAVDVECSVSGGSLVDFTAYSSSAEVTVYTGTAEAEVTIVLKGRDVKQSISYIETYKDDSITQGAVITVDNPFITNMDAAQKITEWVLHWNSKKQQYSADYTGYPELCAGDLVELQTVYGQSLATVLSNTVTFNGGYDGVVTLQ